MSVYVNIYRHLYLLRINILIKQIILEILLSSRDLPVEGQRRMRCPFHSSLGKDFSVVRTTEGIKYHCFSPKCAASGFIPDKAIGYSADNAVRLPVVPHKARFEIPQYIPLGTEHLELLSSRYELSYAQLALNGLGVVGDFIYIPLLGLQGSQIGYQLRRYRGSGSKAKTQYNGTERLVQPLSYTTLPHLVDWICLCEDYYSALKVSEWVPSIALLGSSIAQEDLVTLATTYNTCVMALDPDSAGVVATTKIAKTARFLFKSVVPLNLSKDPKDTPRGQLITAFESYS